jgi:molecular chaperone DnaK
VDVHVLQGEREMASDNKSLGHFNLDGIPAAPRGVPQIEVTFDIDANGILKVSAKDLGTGKEQKITITSSSGLSEDDIQRMVNDAAAHADEDKKQREKIDTKNQAESLVYQTEKQLADNGDKLPANIKSTVEAGLTKLKEAIKTDDTEQIKSAMAAMEKDMHAFAEELYKNANPNGAQGAQGAPGGFNPQDFANFAKNASAGNTGNGGNGGNGNPPGGDGPVYDADFTSKN